MKLQDLEKSIEDLVEPIVVGEGVALVSVEVKKRDQDTILGIYLDKPGGGIDLDTIASLSDEIARHLDVADVIEGSYKLELASPGLERVLRKSREFSWFKGRDVQVKLRQPRDGAKSLLGTLGEANDEGFHLRMGETDLSLRFDEVRQVKLVFEWGKKK